MPSSPVPTAPRLRIGERSLTIAEPILMGIVNASPDSFSDGGRYRTLADRVALANEMMDHGATIVDVGGQSGITGVPEIPEDEEISRVVPIVESLRSARPDAIVSVDTYRPGVAEAALAAGAAIVNDVSGLRHPEIAELCAAWGAGLVITHTRVPPKVKLLDPTRYDDVTGDVVALLHERLAEATRRGLADEATILDPGPDFAKTPHQTVTVLREIGRVRALGRPVLLALSRKDFVGAITGRPPRSRLAGTLAAVGHFSGSTGLILRVHDVAEVADYLKVADALAGRADVPADLELPVHLRREPTRADPPAERSGPG